MKAQLLVDQLLEATSKAELVAKYRQAVLELCGPGARLAGEFSIALPSRGVSLRFVLDGIRVIAPAHGVDAVWFFSGEDSVATSLAAAIQFAVNYDKAAVAKDAEKLARKAAANSYKLAESPFDDGRYVGSRTFTDLYYLVLKQVGVEVKRRGKQAIELPSGRILRAHDETALRLIGNGLDVKVPYGSNAASAVATAIQIDQVFDQPAADSLASKLRRTAAAVKLSYPP
jgi:hypothetical protein